MALPSREGTQRDVATRRATGCLALWLYVLMVCAIPHRLDVHLIFDALAVCMIHIAVQLLRLLGTMTPDLGASVTTDLYYISFLCSLGSTVPRSM